MQQLPLAVRLRERARFANFLAGANGAALQDVQRMCADPAGMLLLTGAPSTGKTHLLLSALAAARTPQRAHYIAMREIARSGAAALEGLSGNSLLCIDDIDSVASDAAIGRALFSWWRDCEERGGGLLLAARELPALEAWALRDLGSRVRGIVARHVLQPLDDEQQRTALQLRARGLGLDLPPDTLEFLLRRLPRDLAAQCDTLDRLDEAALAAQRRLTVPFVREFLAAAQPDRGFGHAPA
jgi:DnaA family protein